MELSTHLIRTARLHELKVPREERVRWVGKHEEIGHPDHWTHTHDSRTVVHHSTSALNRLRTPQKSTYKTALWLQPDKAVVDPGNGNPIDGM